MDVISHAIILILAITFNLGCSQERKYNSELLEFKNDYLDKKSEFELEIVEHFPTKFNDEVTLNFQEGSDVTARSLMLKTFVFDLDSLEVLSEKIQDQSIKSYDTYDSCLLIVNRFLRFNEYGIVNNRSVKMSRSTDCPDDYLPLPKFWDKDQNQDKIIHLSDDYIIYVKESRAGIFSNELHRLSGRYMPDEWKHGYSKGYAVSQFQKSIIYWAIVW